MSRFWLQWPLRVIKIYTVSYKRPEHEDLFVMSHLKKEIQALGNDEDLRSSFLGFAQRVGRADAKKFPPRLYHVLNGRTPSAYISSLIVRYFSERHYERFKRTKINEVDYLTDDEPPGALVRFIENHPLFLQITRVRFTARKWSGNPTELLISVRSPVFELKLGEIPEDEDKFTEALNQRLAEFTLWLAKQPGLPKYYTAKEGSRVAIEYRPSWLSYTDETGFESNASLAGHVDMWEGISLLLFSELGTRSPDVTDGLDHFYSLNELFRGTAGDPAPKRLSFSAYWPRIQRERLGIIRAFYSLHDQFPDPLKASLDSALKEFAKQHRQWVTQAIDDRPKLADESVEYTPTIRESLHYNNVITSFDGAIRPTLQENWKSLSASLIGILELERERARAHFNRMEKILK